MIRAMNLQGKGGAVCVCVVECPAAQLSAAVPDLSLFHEVFPGDDPLTKHRPPTDILELGMAVVESSGAAKAAALALEII